MRAGIGRAVVITPSAVVILDVEQDVARGDLAVVIDAHSKWFAVRPWTGEGELVGRAELIGYAPA